MSTAPPTPAERFALILRALQQAVVMRNRFGGLPWPTIVLVTGRLASIGQRFARLAGRISAGTFRSRRPHTRALPARLSPRPAPQLPYERGWLLPLVPWVPELSSWAGTYRHQLQVLFDDPEMQTLMAAAPAEMGRILRPLCWMLGMQRPDILSRRARPVAEPASPAPPAPAAAPRLSAKARSESSVPRPDPPPAASAPAMSLPVRASGPPEQV